MQRYLSYAASHDGGVGALDLTKSRDPGHLLEEVQLARLRLKSCVKRIYHFWIRCKEVIDCDVSMTAHVMHAITWIAY